MKKLLLKSNYFIFHWYYKRCGEFFRRWTFFQSVKILIDNYDHLNLLYENEIKHNRNLTRDNDEMRKELFQIKMKQLHPDHIDWVNSAFGMDIHKDTEN